MFLHKKDEANEEFSEHIEELCDLYSSNGVVRLVKCRKLGWAGHVALTGETRDAHTIWWRNLLEKRDRQEDARIILSWILGEWVMIMQLEVTGSGSCPVAGF
jgi:hypothetical protein